MTNSTGDLGFIDSSNFCQYAMYICMAIMASSIFAHLRLVNDVIKFDHAHLLDNHYLRITEARANNRQQFQTHLDRMSCHEFRGFQ